MRLQLTLLVLLLLPAISCGAAEPGIDVTATVNRHSEFELTEKQIKILDEATKVSAASRVFHGLYGRWPKDIQELVCRTSGIDLAVFEGNILIDVVPEGLVVTIFDSIDVRRLLATEDSAASPEMQELARDPAFRIRIRLVPATRETGPNNSFKPNPLRGSA
ncbi:hypothetical protein ACO0J1_04820 [Stenotrophomonas acidaminiphila]|uniref:hypothetical protein n=1 Tax=Stenotrophomonas acidaminiphila TaxID=128780 RepID=UPI003BF15583